MPTRPSTTSTASAPTATRRYRSDEERWAAVTSRDRQADGRFLFAVLTTGVYCRPGCPSRLPRRENVRFHESATAAEQAGFRPCKRCRPNGASRDQKQQALVAKACRLIEAAAEAPDLATLANAVGVSRYHFHRLFKAIVGTTPAAYARAVRAQRVRDALPRSATTTAAIHDAGASSNGRFYAQAEKQLGMTPAAYRRGAPDLNIRHATGNSSLGAMLVAATDQGICAILLGDDPQALLRDLQQRFPRAQLSAGDRAFGRWVAQVVALVDAPAIGLALPLDIRGTAFQQRVWQALRDIPCGGTTHYSELAARLGLAKNSARAVAQAIAANPLAVAIPCHRVIRRDGTLAGYRWGIARKQALLDRETKRKRS